MAFLARGFKRILSSKRTFLEFFVAVQLFYVSATWMYSVVMAIYTRYYQLDLLYHLMYWPPKVLPFLIFGCYLFTQALRSTRVNHVLSMVSRTIWLGVVGALAVFVCASCFHAPISTLLGAFTWSYAAAIEWLIFLVVCMWMVKKKLGSSFTALSFGFLASSAGGLLYEIPMYLQCSHTDIYFHQHFPLFISTPYFSLIFLAYMMRREGWRPMWRLHAPLIACWAVWSVIYYFHPHTFPIWFPRLPAIVMLLSFAFGFPAVRDERVVPAE